MGFVVKVSVPRLHMTPIPGFGVGVVGTGFRLGGFRSWTRQQNKPMCCVNLCSI